MARHAGAVATHPYAKCTSESPRLNRRARNTRGTTSALVTGGSRGIGAAIVLRLARDGDDVALTYVSKPDEAAKTVDAATALGVRAIAIRADSADAAAVTAAVDRAAKELGGLDVLVNNAGIAKLAPIDDRRRVHRVGRPPTP